MNDPQQIRRALGEIRRALDSHPREALIEVLALVFKEYVVEGREALASGGQVLDARSDLEGMSFAELIVWLQTHVDLPELALFEVAGADVSVRADGRTVRLRAAPQAAAAAAAPPGAAPAARPPASTAVPMQTTPAAPAAPGAPAAGQDTPAAPGAKEESTAETGTRISLLEVG